MPNDLIERARIVYWQYMERTAAEKGNTVALGEKEKCLRGDLDHQHGVKIALAALESSTQCGETVGCRDAALEEAWREGWSLAKQSLTDDEAFTLTGDVEQDAWADSQTRRALKSASPTPARDQALDEAREAFERILDAPLIDHSDKSRSKDGIAREAITKLDAALRSSPRDQALDEAAKAKVLEELQTWTGSAFLAGEETGAEIESQRKTELYSFLCGLLGWFYPEEPALRSSPKDQAPDRRTEAMHDVAERLAGRMGATFENAPIHAQQRLEAVANGGDVADVYGSEWCFDAPGTALRADLRTVLTALRSSPSVPVAMQMAEALNLAANRLQRLVVDYIAAGDPHSLEYGEWVEEARAALKAFGGAGR